MPAGDHITIGTKPPHQPLVNPHKWTTKVNIAVVVAVLVVLLAGAIWAWRATRDPEQIRREVDEQVGRP